MGNREAAGNPYFGKPIGTIVTLITEPLGNPNKNTGTPVPVTLGNLYRNTGKPMGNHCETFTKNMGNPNKNIGKPIPKDFCGYVVFIAAAGAARPPRSAAHSGGGVAIDVSAGPPLPVSVETRSAVGSVGGVQQPSTKGAFLARVASTLFMHHGMSWPQAITVALDCWNRAPAELRPFAAGDAPAGETPAAGVLPPVGGEDFDDACPLASVDGS
jgi:hypothetical protein